jgi:hypothetical protein
MRVIAQAEPPISGNFAAAEEPDVAHHAQTESAPTWASPETSIEAGSLLPPISPVVAFSRVTSESPREPRGPSKSNSGVMIGIAVAALLVAVVSVWAWLVYSHRNISTAARMSNVPQQSITTQPIPRQNQEAIASPQQPPKPSSRIPQYSASILPHSPSRPGSTVVPGSAFTTALAATTQHNGSIAPQPATPVSLPEAPRSGVRHFQGSVPHNGFVVFDNLPKARLKFNFDRQAWTLTIKPNPDGTKRVTLISQMPGYQTSCDLGWEIIE